MGFIKWFSLAIRIIHNLAVVNTNLNILDPNERASHGKQSLNSGQIDWLDLLFRSFNGLCHESFTMKLWSSRKQYFSRKTFRNYKSQSFSIEHILNLVIYGFKDSTGVNLPNESFNSSSESSLKRSRSESSSSIRAGVDLIGTCSSIIGQLDSSKISSRLSSHCFHSNPKHEYRSFSRFNVFLNSELP